MRSPAGETRTSQTVALPKSFAMGTIGGAWAGGEEEQRGRAFREFDESSAPGLVRSPHSRRAYVGDWYR